MVKLVDFVDSLVRMRQEIQNNTYLDIEGILADDPVPGAASIGLVCVAAIGGACLALGVCCCYNLNR